MLELFLYGIPLLFVGILILAYFMTKIGERRLAAIHHYVSNIQDFKMSQFRLGEDGLNAIVSDNSNCKFCIVDTSSKHIYHKLYDASDIVSMDTREDGHLTTSTSRTDQLSNAMIGGAIFGKTGAAIGALTSETITTEQVSHVDLIVRVKDYSLSTHTISFLNTTVPKSSFTYRNAIEETQRWISIADLLKSIASNSASITTGPTVTVPIYPDDHTSPSITAFINDTEYGALGYVKYMDNAGYQLLREALYIHNELARFEISLDDIGDSGPKTLARLQEIENNKASIAADIGEQALNDEVQLLQQRMKEYLSTMSTISDKLIQFQQRALDCEEELQATTSLYHLSNEKRLVVANFFARKHGI